LAAALGKSGHQSSVNREKVVMGKNPSGKKPRSNPGGVAKKAAKAKAAPKANKPVNKPEFVKKKGDLDLSGGGEP
jgi:hypothetical protein